MHEGHGGHGAHGAHGHGAHGHEGHHGGAPGEGDIATGTISSISGSSFALRTKEGEVTVATDERTNFHTPGVAKAAKQAGYDGYADLTSSALKVGQQVGVMGERRDDATLLARRVHIPQP
jgi:Domain of unknown function (DUF5666)